MSLTQILKTELLASSRVEGKKQGCARTDLGTHQSPGSDPNTYGTFFILTVTACTAQEIEALESWLLNLKARGCGKWELGIRANLVPGITKPMSSIPLQENRWWTRGFAGF